MLKRLKQRKTSRLLNIKDKERNILTKEIEIMERWCQYFEELTENIQKETTWDEMRLSRTEENAIHLISDKELRTAIGKSKVGKAPGQDDITAETMKYLEEEEGRLSETS